MKSNLRIEPPQLSESRWSKIEDAVFDQLDAAPPAPIAAPQRKIRVLAFGAVATGLAIAAGVLLMVKLQSHQPSYAHAPSRIVTGADHSHLSLGESEIDVLADTAVVASGDDIQGVLLVLEKGGIDCEVAPRGKRPPFIVQAGDTRVRVVGTKFKVSRGAAGDVEVSVEHGTVEVTRHGETARVHGGEHWAPRVAAPAITAQTTASATTEATVQAQVRLTEKQMYESAAKHERRDPEFAMNTYRTLAHGSSPWASNALFAAGRLALERGKKSEGERILEQYLKRYPKGPNAEDAKRLLGH
jgi:ferric-dicitrate binding protein FerR (iron transport regulator)